MATTPDNIHQTIYEQQTFWRSRTVLDWVWAVAVFAATFVAWNYYRVNMDGYEVIILVSIAPLLVGLGWLWRQVPVLLLIVSVFTLLSLWLYGADIKQADSNFFLKYLISSQSAVMWMSALFVMATVAYIWGMLAQSEFVARIGTALTWSGITMGLTGLFVRWRESYLIDPDYGHIPVSNLYEVFILFCVIAGLIYLFYEKRSGIRSMGGFALLLISASVGFILWYTFDREAHVIQPLVPALKSYWMKIHVPANFFGYGAFGLAAMLGVGYFFAAPADGRSSGGFLARRLPSTEVLDDVMYKMIAFGFAFFTLATILGALWAAEAWGSYWSWDPKETWALIVWLNYAAWLHMRVSKGWRGRPMAWWSIVGLLITTFAFLGVNMFLSGLHSYGEL